MVVARKGNEFAAEIAGWVVEMKDYTKLVWQRSMLELVIRMQMPISRGGNMPVRTGFLRSSLRASTSVRTIPNQPRIGDGPFVYWPTDIERVIMSAKIGETVYLGYEAEYAMYAEYGNGQYAGHGFMRLAVQMWPTIVNSVVAGMRSK